MLLNDRGLNHLEGTDRRSAERLALECYIHERRADRLRATVEALLEVLSSPSMSRKREITEHVLNQDDEDVGNVQRLSSTP